MNGTHPTEDADFLPLVQDLLAQGRLVQVEVTGGSMAPWLISGDVVILRAASPEAFVPGDIVLARHPEGTTLLHRVIARRRLAGGDIGYLLKGDALGTVDGLLGAGSLLGRVVAIRRPTARGGAREISLETAGRRVFERCLASASRGIPRLFPPASRLLLRLARRPPTRAG